MNNKILVKHLILTVLIFSGMVVLMAGCSGNNTKETLEAKAARIHKAVLTVDTHTDTPLRIMREDFDLSQRHDPVRDHSKLDFPRMVEGGLDAVFFAAFIGQGPRDDAGHENAKTRVLEIIDSIHQNVKRYSDLATLALDSESPYAIEKTNKRAIFIGIENGYPVGHDLSLIQKYYNLGVRYITLCHTKNNDICDSSTDPNGPEYHGLSELGEQVVAEMNRLGMIIDVSHISDEAFYDVLETSAVPVMASHSCSRAICDNPRNLDDDMLRALAKNNGVIQMCILSDYVKTPAPNAERDSAFAALRNQFDNYDNASSEAKKKMREQWRKIDEKYPKDLATVSDVVDHIDHMVKIAGIDHVGIGTDFDGGGGVDGCFDVSQMGNITLELVKRRYTEEQIRKIWGGNFIRVFKAVEAYAANTKI
jgi:membrane dipeptidase